MTTNPFIYANGTQMWYVNNKYHRTNGPAIVDTNGTQSWFVNGKCHREDGPAVVCADGTQHWYVNGKRHRLDGPAYIGTDGTQEWWVNDNYVTSRKEYQLLANLSDEDMTMLVLKYGNIE